MKTLLSAYINLKKEREISSVNRSQGLNMCVTIGVGEISFFCIYFHKINGLLCSLGMVCNLHLQQHLS